MLVEAEGRENDANDGGGARVRCLGCGDVDRLPVNSDQRWEPMMAARHVPNCHQSRLCMGRIHTQVAILCRSTDVEIAVTLVSCRSCRQGKLIFVVGSGT